jgi:hypothetical protein
VGLEESPAFALAGRFFALRSASPPDLVSPSTDEEQVDAKDHERPGEW